MTTNSPAAANAVTNAAAEGLRDIVGPVPIANLKELLILGVITLVVLAVAAYFLRAWWLRRKLLLSQGPPPPPPVPAHERARRRLDDALRLLGDPDRFCTTVSLVLREYIEERFGWNAPDRTTEEFLAEVRRHEVLPVSFQELLQEFLTRCDYVKFARYDPTETELRALHQSAVRFVSDTVPPPPPPAGLASPRPGAVPANP